jgi:hypothetical protein
MLAEILLLLWAFSFDVEMDPTAKAGIYHIHFRKITNQQILPLGPPKRRFLTAMVGRVRIMFRPTTNPTRPRLYDTPTPSLPPNAFLPAVRATGTV